MMINRLISAGESFLVGEAYVPSRVIKDPVYSLIVLGDAAVRMIKWICFHPRMTATHRLLLVAPPPW